MEWKEAVKGDTNGFVEIKPEQTNELGYYVSSSKEGMNNKPSLYMDGTQTAPDSQGLETLGTLYKTFFPHAGAWNNCYGYWIASPSGMGLGYLMIATDDGKLGDNMHGFHDSEGVGLRPVIIVPTSILEKSGDEWNLKI